ncbi:MAG: S1C family serine protease [Lachnospiraceae bacterium]|nr:S1C family serine protease [Lachnospiraceae bacterium]
MASIQFRHNMMHVDSIDSFFSIRGGFHSLTRDVYFVRALGESDRINEQILSFDRRMETDQTGYVRLQKLPVLTDPGDIAFYSGLFDAFSSGKRKPFRNLSDDVLFLGWLKDALAEIMNLYRTSRTGVSRSMERNLGTKFLFWLDTLMCEVLVGWTPRSVIKVAADNVTKEQEYLFYLMLTFLGCDVLLYETKADVPLPQSLLSYSVPLVQGSFGTTPVTPYRKMTGQMQTQPSAANRAGVTGQNPAANRAGVAGQRSAAQGVGTKRQTAPAANTVPAVPKRREAAAALRTEKSYEELARLAASVVLIGVHKPNGEITATGSGIMIGTEGYILTNHHVASGGSFYSVRVEDDETVYTTNEVIKYNPDTDLSIIRIQRKLTPIPVYGGEKPLVRGQRVIAIGSPLGLFNSVSDGIISGFRTIRDVDMIQFTAPISHGSSGGAVLNMYGEIIGISTAGIDSGQNINLAVGYETIRLFTRGFTG